MLGKTQIVFRPTANLYTYTYTPAHQIIKFPSPVSYLSTHLLKSTLRILSLCFSSFTFLAKGRQTKRAAHPLVRSLVIKGTWGRAGIDGPVWGCDGARYCCDGTSGAGWTHREAYGNATNASVGVHRTLREISSQLAEAASRFAVALEASRAIMSYKLRQSNWMREGRGEVLGKECGVGVWCGNDEVK